jgi:hypothetical protein
LPGHLYFSRKTRDRDVYLGMTKKMLPLGALLVLVSACASPTTPSNDQPTPASSTAIHNAISTVLSGLTASINGTRSGSKGFQAPQSAAVPLMTPIASVLGPAFTQQCNAAGTSCSVQFNESFNQPARCSGGGSSNTSATLTGVIQGSATSLAGTLNLSVRSTFADCSEGGWVTNSNPSLSTNGQMFITSQHMRLNLTMSGGMVITNAPNTPQARSSCVTNGVLLQWDDITGNWADSGSIDCTPGGSFRFQ